MPGVDAARELGFRVHVSRPAEAERGLAYAGLCDLFEGVLEQVLPVLPAPRRRALEVALLLEGGDTADPRTLGVAVRSGLEVLAAEAPVVLAVDDVQWLDPSSASALVFALRRLDEQSIPCSSLVASVQVRRRRTSSGLSLPTESSGYTSAR